MKLLRDSLKAQLAIDAAMKRELCGLHGCADEDDLPDAIQDMDLGTPSRRTVARRRPSVRRLPPAGGRAAAPPPRPPFF